MSSQDSEGESLVSHQPLDPNVFKKTFPYFWFPDEEEDTDSEDIPPRFQQDSNAASCKKILKLELENEDLRDDNFSLRRKLEKKNMSSSSPPPSSSPKET
jgi:hypothetical protein